MLKINAQKFDEMFYQTEKGSSEPDAKQIMAMLADNPELLGELKNLLIKTE
ncbi:MAG: hypothetical protein FWC90_00455 [Oscillospiraceae bacterium]|nr:hypothetical protein [Oscillospiraceae bacterium]